MEIFKINKEFDFKDDFVKLYKNVFIANDIDYKVFKNDQIRVKLGCKTKSCQFQLYITWVKSKSKFVIKKSNIIHTCLNNDVNLRGLCNLILEEENNFNITSKNLIELIYKEKGINVKYSTASAAILAFQKNKGYIFEESYECLETLMKIIIKNGDSAILLKSIENEFKWIYIGWKSLKNNFNFSKKIIAVDGTFLSGPNGGICLTAIISDGLNQLNILGFAIVESENLDSWSWFFKQLNNDYNINNIENIIISDRDKGLIQSINNELPNVTRSSCCFHISKNLTTKFKLPTINTLIWQAAKTYNLKNFEELLNKIKILSKNAFNYLMSSNPNLWANSKFDGVRYGILTSNYAESINSALKKFIHFDITNFIVSVNNYQMEKFSNRKNMSFNDIYLPNIRDKINENLKEGYKLECKMSSKFIFICDSEFIINLENNTCTCNVFQDYKFPCVHACSAITKAKYNIYNFVSKYYLTETY